MRKVFLMPAGGGADDHYRDTIQRKRTFEEIENFVEKKDFQALSQIHHGKNFAVWGSLPGAGKNYWLRMEPGDLIIFSKAGKYIFVGEISYKIHNPKLAEYFWKKNNEGNTWEYMYFIINEKEISVEIPPLNSMLSYSLAFSPRGIMAVDEGKLKHFQNRFGDIYDVMMRLDKGRKVDEKFLPAPVKVVEDVSITEEKPPTEHTEIQWRLIRLGMAAGSDIWVPRNDQGREYDGQLFRDHVLTEFAELIDVPTPIKNIDVVWKYGYQVKAAFEVENTTTIYSGLLRLSDLRVMAPNSNYPMYIVASKEKLPRFCDQLSRPTFADEHIRLGEAVKFLSYDSIREFDEHYQKKPGEFNVGQLEKAAIRCS